RKRRACTMQLVAGGKSDRAGRGEGAARVQSDVAAQRTPLAVERQLIEAVAQRPTGVVKSKTSEAPAVLAAFDVEMRDGRALNVDLPGQGQRRRRCADSRPRLELQTDVGRVDHVDAYVSRHQRPRRPAARDVVGAEPAVAAALQNDTPTERCMRTVLAASPYATSKRKGPIGVRNLTPTP